MPTLLLSARQTDDAQLLWRACIELNWKVVRVHDWRVPAIETKDLAVYGEPLFAHHVAQTLGLKLQEPPLDWLPKLMVRPMLLQWVKLFPIGASTLGGGGSMAQQPPARFR